MKGVKYISMAETSGYGLSAVAYIRALRRAGIPITWHPMVWEGRNYAMALNTEQALDRLHTLDDRGDLGEVFRAPLQYDTVIIQMSPEHWPGAIEPGKRMVGYTVWETDRLPLHWPVLFRGYHLILTPSTFSRNVIVKHTDLPVVVIPHFPREYRGPVDKQACTTFRRRFAIEADDFVFYTINSWILRKAMWLTLQAFLLAFARQERAVLILKTSHEGERDGRGMVPSRLIFDRILANYSDPAKVVFVADELSEDDLSKLHLCGDTYVSLSRGEGFGMGAYDAAGAGTPVIMTGWGGQLDFLSREHACLVDFELQQVHEHLANHAPQEQYWAHAKLDDAIRWLRQLYENPDEARARGAGLKSYIRQHFDPHEITQRLLRALNG